MHFTEKQLAAYREYFRILGNIARRIEMEKRAGIYQSPKEHPRVSSLRVVYPPHG
ncbi:MAG: hypothetical protein V1926_01820 [Candidatus Peregrinibacteria bacterium]